MKAFEKAIEQPLELGQGTRTDLQPRYPGDEVDPVRRARGNNAGYLMSRLMRIDPDIQDKIGKGLEYPSINAASQALGVVPKRQRYELNPEVNTGNAAARIVDILGPAKAAELTTAITLLLTSNGSN